MRQGLLLSWCSQYRLGWPQGSILSDAGASMQHRAQNFIFHVGSRDWIWVIVLSKRVLHALTYLPNFVPHFVYSVVDRFQHWLCKLAIMSSATINSFSHYGYMISASIYQRLKHSSSFNLFWDIHSNHWWTNLHSNEQYIQAFLPCASHQYSLSCIFEDHYSGQRRNNNLYY